jgi:hypothetical protein
VSILTSLCAPGCGAPMTQRYPSAPACGYEPSRATRRLERGVEGLHIVWHIVLWCMLWLLCMLYSGSWVHGEACCGLECMACRH